MLILYFSRRTAIVLYNFIGNHSFFSRSPKRQPLLDLKFAVINSKKENRKKIKQTVNNLGGIVHTRIHRNLAAVISNRKDIQKDSVLLEKAKECNVLVVSEEFLLDAAHSNDLSQCILKRSLCEWGKDVSIKQITFLLMKITRLN